MADNNEDVLRKSLDAVDRHRNRVLFGLGAAIAFLVAVLIPTLMGAMHGHSGNNAQAILAHYFILLIWVTALTLVVVIQIAVATKRILRAIELAAKNPRP
jgi:uncharacterized membrane protein